MVARGRITKFGLKPYRKIKTRHNGNTSTKDVTEDEVIVIVKERPLFYSPFRRSEPKVTHVMSAPAVVHALKNPRNIIVVDLGEKSTDDKIKWSLKIGEEVSKAVTSGELNNVKNALKRIGVVDGGRKGSAEAYRRVIIDTIDKIGKQCENKVCSQHWPTKPKEGKANKPQRGRNLKETATQPMPRSPKRLSLPQRRPTRQGVSLHPLRKQASFSS